MTPNATTTDATARALVVPDEKAFRLELSGAWRITGDTPDWDNIAVLSGFGTSSPASSKMTSITASDSGAVVIHPDVSHILTWDTSLLLFLRNARSWCQNNQATFDESTLPENLRHMLGTLTDVHVHELDKQRRPNILAAAGNASVACFFQLKQFTQFVGECVLSTVNLVRRPLKFRWRDCFYEMQRCGAMALPIVGLISYLVGVILAYIGAIVLRQYGGDIFIADIVGLAMVREMGAMMTGIVLAGRTGGAFAAQIANMKAGEEIDALVTLGIRPIDFLVIPRIVALAVMMPLLSLYSNMLGNLGGMTVGALLLKIPVPAYWIEMQSILDLSDISTGLIKATTYGIIIGLAGCLRGLQAQRDAAGVGSAATSAVVTAMLYIIIACAVYAVIFNILGW